MSITELYFLLTWAYHAEAMAKTEAERAVTRFEREFINQKIMEFSK